MLAPSRPRGGCAAAIRDSWLAAVLFAFSSRVGHCKQQAFRAQLRVHGVAANPRRLGGQFKIRRRKVLTLHRLGCDHVMIAFDSLAKVRVDDFSRDVTLGFELFRIPFLEQAQKYFVRCKNIPEYIYHISLRHVMNGGQDFGGLRTWGQQRKNERAHPRRQPLR
jgi:hypothetical protein